MGKPNAKDNIDHKHGKFARLSVIVRCVSAPDAETRIDRAMNILLAAAEGAAMMPNEVTDHEEDSPCEKNADDVGQ